MAVNAAWHCYVNDAHEQIGALSTGSVDVVISKNGTCTWRRLYIPSYRSCGVCLDLKLDGAVASNL